MSGNIPSASGNPELTVYHIMSSIQKAVKPKSKHAIASLPGNILRLSRTAGNLILKARQPRQHDTLEGYIIGRLQQFEKKSGINFHFTSGFDAGSQPRPVKANLMCAAFILQLHGICACGEVSMLVTKLVPAGNQVSLSLTCICMNPCEKLEQPAAGFKKLQQRITQAGGSLSHTSEPGSSYTLEVILPLAG